MTGTFAPTTPAQPKCASTPITLLPATMEIHARIPIPAPTGNARARRFRAVETPTHVAEAQTHAAGAPTRVAETLIPVVEALTRAVEILTHAVAWTATMGCSATVPKLVPMENVNSATSRVMGPAARTRMLARNAHARQTRSAMMATRVP